MTVKKDVLKEYIDAVYDKKQFYEDQYNINPNIILMSHNMYLLLKAIWQKYIKRKLYICETPKLFGMTIITDINLGLYDFRLIKGEIV